MPRAAIYAELSAVLGRQYHTAELRTLDEAELIYGTVTAIAARAAQGKTQD
jgi:hypothetical protein